MSKGEWEALGRKVDELERSDCHVDAAIYVRVELDRRDAGEKLAPVSARLSRVPGKVVCTYESGRTGTCNSPDYSRDLNALERLLGDVDEIEIARNEDGTFRATVEGLEGHPARPSRALALLSAACRHKAEQAA